MPIECKQQDTSLRKGKFGMKRYNQMSLLCKIAWKYNRPYRRRAGEERAARLTVKRVRLALTSVLFVVVVID